MLRFFSTKLAIRKCLNYQTMKVFTQKVNPITGVNDWVVQNEDYDYHQEVARSSFADMLHDTERNQLYEKALKSAIDTMHSKGKKANVLDIGTGTGLLSMMAARNGADSIVACEAFKPMSECAVNVIKQNGFDKKIRIISKRSTELVVGPNNDLEERCNILVTEVFDTELIGEGALSTFSHAHKKLLEEDCIVVPHSATIFAQVVECPITQNWNKLKDILADGEILVKVPRSIKHCAGSAAVHDIQMSQLPTEEIKTIISPTPVLRFDWSGKNPLYFEHKHILTANAEASGNVQAVFMWWELQMDPQNEFILSCAPFWAHPLYLKQRSKEIPWRDHWMQAVYYLPKEVPIKKGDKLHLITCHDEYSLWFNICLNLEGGERDYVNPVCECGLHINFSRTRIGQINDENRIKKYVSLQKQYVNNKSTVLTIGDGFYSSLVASKLGARRVICLETNSLSKRILDEFIAYNKLDNVTVIPDPSAIKSIVSPKEINIVFAEPYFVSSILPWDNMLYFYLLHAMRPYIADNAEVFPKVGTIKAVAVLFNDLHKIRAPLGKCEGFDMEEFDKLIKESSEISDDKVEAQPLWEYPAVAVSEVITIAAFEADTTPGANLDCKGTFKIEHSNACNGVALWIDWIHDKDVVVSTGPVSPTKLGEVIQWDMHTRQGVCLFATKSLSFLEYEFAFRAKEGAMSFKFKEF